MPGARRLLALVTLLHRSLYRATGGRIGASGGGIEILLLTSVGRRSGRRRVAPLLYIRDGGRWVVVGSNAGDEQHPAWWLNLEARPDAEIQVRAERFEVRARRASPEEARRLWPGFEARWGRYRGYRARTKREIPVVILERTV
jgi:deazaflavin-dependent oxidoreductase (nitroreductase family)